jgi:phospholipase C
MSRDPALERIEHIVVVMMENRSFDHMLGYLMRDGMPEVNGLTGDEFNLGPDGTKVPITAFDADAHHIQHPGEALQKKLDPDHSKPGVQIQIGPGYGDAPMGGFVKSFLDTRKPEDHIARDLWIVPMGHYTAKDLPVYDHLARTFCVCDAWHASVPGDTWPNRLYAMAGREGDRIHHSLLERLGDLLPGNPLKALEGAPIFDVPGFTRQLADHQWRWYSHDPATLRAADGHYRRFDDLKRENFSYFDRKKVAPLTQAVESPIVGADSFLDDAANGALRDVSWIDPNFIDLNVLDPNSNDDHPPSDIRAGQAFMLDVYEALRRSPTWNETLLIVAYDEHGGFYDHQPPPAIDDDSGYETLGIRVPALLAGPRVKQLVCHERFEHASIIRTILERFAAHPGRAIAAMPPRVAAAASLAPVLQEEPRTDLADPDEARVAIDAWRITARARRQADRAGAASPEPDGAGRPFVMHDFQDEFARFALAMRQAGLPSGQP